MPKSKNPHRHEETALMVAVGLVAVIVGIVALPMHPSWWQFAVWLGLTVLAAEFVSRVWSHWREARR